MPNLTIDNCKLCVPDGATILDAAKLAGIDIPTLCALPGKAARPACMVCVVRVNGSARLAPSCATPVAEGMSVQSNIEDVLNARRTAIELLLSEHLGDCIGPCTRGCPAHLDTPRVMRQIAEGRFHDALVTVKQTIALPAVLGRICPEVCEKSCRLSGHDGAVSVCQVKRFVADLDLASPTPYLPPCANSSGKSIAIVGTGPTGLSAAYYLLQQGHACTLFDEHEFAGGMLRYGIPEDTLPRNVLDSEVRIIERLGAQFKYGHSIDRDISLKDLRQQFNAVLLASGSRSDTTIDDLEITVGPHGIIVDRSTMATSVPGVFAAGGAIAPIQLAVRAVADGRAAAVSIGHFLSGSDSVADKPGFNFHASHKTDEELHARMPIGSPRQRISPAGGPASGFTAQEAQAEAARCLQCSCAGAATCKLRDLAQRCGASASRFRGERHAYSRDDSHPEVLFEAGKCIACGICVRLAAGFGQGFQGHGSQITVGGPFGAPIIESLGDAARACAQACPTGALTLKENECD